MMRSATDFLPRRMTMLMKRDSRSLPNFGSGRVGRFGAEARLDMWLYSTCALIRVIDRTSGLRPLGAVLRAPLATRAHACAVERSADRVVAHAREVLHATATDHHDR